MEQLREQVKHFKASGDSAASHNIKKVLGPFTNHVCYVCVCMCVCVWFTRHIHIVCLFDESFSASLAMPTVALHCQEWLVEVFQKSY